MLVSSYQLPSSIFILRVKSDLFLVSPLCGQWIYAHRSNPTPPLRLVFAGPTFFLCYFAGVPQTGDICGNDAVPAESAFLAAVRQITVISNRQENG
jgi:hypothetical protein